MDGSKDSHCEIHHFKGFGDDDGFAFKACKPMALSAVISLNPMSMLLALNEFLSGNKVFISLIMIYAIKDDFKFF